MCIIAWISQTRTLLAPIVQLGQRLGRDARGNVAMLFGLSLPVLLMVTMGGVDIHRITTVRVNLQDALDAAALAAARSPYADDENLQRVGLAALRANLQAYPDVSLVEGSTRFTVNSDHVVVADASVSVRTLVANIVLPPYGKLLDDYVPVGARSEVNRSSKNIEVALVLDVTGSMKGARLEQLKDAAEDLIELVVQPVQTPYYTRMAIIPYSSGVNLAGRANSARGAPTGAINISGASWSTGSEKAITAITRANPGQVTSNGHGFVTGDFIWIRNVLGMTAVNNRAYRVVRVDNNRFTLQSWNGSSWQAVATNGWSYGTYLLSGTAQKCQVSDCSVVVTANNHGMANGATVYITDVRGMTQVNNTGYAIGNVTTNTFSIGANGASWGGYTSGGKSWCGADGCQWRVWTNPNGALTWAETTTCVSERTGAQAYTDVSPSSARVGSNYSGTANPCPAQAVQPLTSDRATLTGLIDDLEDDGSTAGQIGAAWGWYAVSPNFNGLWSSNPAAAYAPNDVLKAVVIMTDGEFNTPYCTGVIARDSTSGSGATANKIDCNATNGDPYVQTENLCAGMRQRGIIVYTVGFQMDANGRGAQTLNRCATSGSAFLPASGADLSDAFKAIGRDITRLRISR